MADRRPSANGRHCSATVWYQTRRYWLWELHQILCRNRYRHFFQKASYKMRISKESRNVIIQNIWFYIFLFSLDINHNVKVLISLMFIFGLSFHPFIVFSQLKAIVLSLNIDPKSVFMCLTFPLIIINFSPLSFKFFLFVMTYGNCPPNRVVIGHTDLIMIMSGNYCILTSSGTFTLSCVVMDCFALGCSCHIGGVIS